MKTVLITGNTYPVKDQLRELGGKWNPSAKGWYVPAKRAQEAQQLVNSAVTSPRGTGRNTGRRSAGRRTGCQCGSREDSSGCLIPSPNNCWQCEHDA